MLGSPSRLYPWLKRMLDVALVLVAACLFLIPMLAITIAVKVTSPGPVLYWSDRVGRRNRIFRMPKFRTMRTDTPQVATHLLFDADQWLTPIGGLLRSTSLDELPQLWSIFVGHMSVVGPRPALYNQDDLIALRTEKGVHELPPGLTGWAQVNGRDELPIPLKVDFETEYLRRRSILLDLQIILQTAVKVFRREGICHPTEPGQRPEKGQPESAVSDSQRNAA